jgi:hypothetical protein
VSRYSYDRTTGARHTINNADVQCRISAYGDSYTHGDQVNDGETWEEILAARIGEPILNLGIGGYSVCQMFRRLRLVEHKLHSKLIIMNIYEDDHYRSLVPLPQIRSIRPMAFHAPVPYVKANPATEEFVEYENPCRSVDELYNLCDTEWICETFRDAFAIRIMLAKFNVMTDEPQDSYADVEELSEQYGAPAKIRTKSKLLQVANALFAHSATYASMRMIRSVNQFATKLGRKVLFVTSYGPGPVSESLNRARVMDIPERRRPSHAYNSEFVDFMKKSGLPWVDLAELHVSDYSDSYLSVKKYLAKYYVNPADFGSHYAPTGNWFTAAAIKDRVVDLLNPKPPAYRHAGLEWDGSVAMK